VGQLDRKKDDVSGHKQVLLPMSIKTRLQNYPVKSRWQWADPLRLCLVSELSFFFGCSLPFLNESILNPDLECTWGIYPFRLSANADNIVFLQETKVANISQHIYLSVFGSAYDNYVALPANGPRGVLGHMKINLCSCKNLEMLGHTLQVSY
jgi:hypothetical protein